MMKNIAFIDGAYAKNNILVLETTQHQLSSGIYGT